MADNIVDFGPKPIETRPKRHFLNALQDNPLKAIGDPHLKVSYPGTVFRTGLFG